MLTQLLTTERKISNITGSSTFILTIHIQPYYSHVSLQNITIIHKSQFIRPFISLIQDILPNYQLKLRFQSIIFQFSTPYRNEKKFITPKNLFNLAPFVLEKIIQYYAQPYTNQLCCSKEGYTIIPIFRDIDAIDLTFLLHVLKNREHTNHAFQLARDLIKQQQLQSKLYRKYSKKDQSKVSVSEIFKIICRTDSEI